MCVFENNFMKKECWLWMVCMGVLCVLWRTGVCCWENNRHAALWIAIRAIFFSVTL